MTNQESWIKFENLNKDFVDRLRSLYEFEKLYNEDFYMDSDDFSEMSNIWIVEISKKISDDFFLEIGNNRDLKKGIQKFCDAFTSNEKNYDYLYQNSSGFRFFIDSTPDYIIKIFRDDQRKTNKYKKTMKILWAIRTAGISLLTDELIDLGFKGVGAKKLSEIALNEKFNSIFFAIAYSPYWS
jgi:hypothetical protein